MRLVGGAVKAKARQAEYTDENAIDFIQSPTLPQQAMRSLVESDQHPMHEMACDQHERNGQEVEVVQNRGDKGRFGQKKESGDTGNAMLLTEWRCGVSESGSVVVELCIAVTE
jgi:hypothetical protein